MSRATVIVTGRIDISNKAAHSYLRHVSVTSNEELSWPKHSLQGNTHMRGAARTMDRCAIANADSAGDLNKYLSGPSTDSNDPNTQGRISPRTGTYFRV